MAVIEDLPALVARAKENDGDAWEALYHHVYPRLFAFARRRLPPDDARDAVSETMTRAVKAIDRFEPRGYGFEGWLFGICRHVVADQHRAAGRRPRKALDEPTDRREPDEELLRGEEAAAVRVAFAKLSPADRELLELRVVAGLSSEDAAAALGKKPGAVRMAQARALEKLRAHLEEVTA